MKAIIITKGKIAGVDDEDFERVTQFKWCAQKRKNGFHAARYFGKKYVYMHQFVSGVFSGIDHRDGDGLNNSRGNLRAATKSQNSSAFQGPRKGTSRFRGVCWHARANKWMARLEHNKKGVYVGVFESEEVAARAYDKKARELFGEFASPNFPL